VLQNYFAYNLFTTSLTTLFCKIPSLAKTTLAKSLLKAGPVVEALGISRISNIEELTVPLQGLQKWKWVEVGGDRWKLADILST